MFKSKEIYIKKNFSIYKLKQYYKIINNSQKENMDLHKIEFFKKKNIFLIITIITHIIMYKIN